MFIQQETALSVENNIRRCLLSPLFSHLSCSCLFSQLQECNNLPLSKDFPKHKQTNKTKKYYFCVRRSYHFHEYNSMQFISSPWTIFIFHTHTNPAATSVHECRNTAMCTAICFLFLISFYNYCLLAFFLCLAVCRSHCTCLGPLCI